MGYLDEILEEALSSLGFNIDFMKHVVRFLVIASWLLFGFALLIATPTAISAWKETKRAKKCKATWQTVKSLECFDFVCDQQCGHSSFYGLSLRALRDHLVTSPRFALSSFTLAYGLFAV